MPSRDAKPGDAKPAAKPDDVADAKAKPESKPADADAADDADGDAPSIAAPEKSARAGSGLHEFRDERWVELYAKKIEEMIAVLKSKGVPVLWVGLPAVRGPKAMSDTLFLNSLYRDAAGKAGITYVDVWDGFVDEAGRFLQQGPDFEGQIRRLRSADGVYFTKAGARKLAHYAEREITRLMAARSGPIALPTEPATPDANALPGQPAPRPLAGPILPLVASSVGTDQLLGGPGSRPAAVDALAARTLVKGEPLAPPAGRADDFVWPRREVGREQAKGETPVASTAPDGRRPLRPRRRSRWSRGFARHNRTRLHLGIFSVLAQHRARQRRRRRHRADRTLRPHRVRRAMSGARHQSRAYLRASDSHESFRGDAKHRTRNLVRR